MNKNALSVLIVDDNDMMRTILRGMLRGDEYEIVGEARNGVQAVEAAERLRPAIVCMDVLMPEKNGLVAMVEIKAAHPEIEFIVITGSADPHTVQEAIHHGATGFIVKPFNAARVLDAMKKAATRIRQRPPAA
ncbi:response regulator transcription factor [Azonexus sp.]|uniref:response regulator transcription factor n=1 Tax=Azonexus sp. TaxID=1872668 RepID=UPI0035B30385